MIASAEILTAIRELTNSKQLDRAELRVGDIETRGMTEKIKDRPPGDGPFDPFAHRSQEILQVPAAIAIAPVDRPLPPLRRVAQARDAAENRRFVKW